MSIEAGPGGEARPPAARWRNGLWIAAVVLAGLQLWRDPTDAVARVLTIVGLVGLLVVVGFAAQHVETRTERPRKTYLRWALGVAVLGLAFVAMPLAIGAGIVIGLMLWTGFAAAGLVWAVYYERSEPL